MFIKSLSNNSVDRFGRVCRVVTDHGKFKNYNIAVEHTFRNGIEQEKLFVIWDNWMQMIVPKSRKGNKFERIG